MTEQSKIIERLYEAYPSWKSSNFQSNAANEEILFAQEFAHIDLAPNAKVLDVGFGDGHFLDWARDRGFRVEGVEISSAYVAAAKARGHKVFLGTVKDAKAHGEGIYDAIVCFDILEHLSLEEIVSFFGEVKVILAENGVVLARFPNGGSPFGRYYQQGDATHITALTGIKLDQLSMLSGIRVTSSYNAARLALPKKRFLDLGPRYRKWAFSYIEKLIGETFLGTRLPMAPNLTVQLRHENKLTSQD